MTYHSTVSFKRALFRLLLAFVIVMLCAVPFVVYAQTTPGVVPPDVLAQGHEVHVIDKGHCQRPEGDMLCMYGLHDSMTYSLILVFNPAGILVQVFRINRDQVERKLWQHPQFTG